MGRQEDEEDNLNWGGISELWAQEDEKDNHKEDEEDNRAEDHHEEDDNEEICIAYDLEKDLQQPTNRATTSKSGARTNRMNGDQQNKRGPAGSRDQQTSNN